MKTAMESIKDMVDVNTVVGDPVEAPDGSVIVPVSRVTFGFAAGGGDFEGGREGGGGKNGDSGDGAAHPFAGGSGAGVSVQPVGFLVVGQGTVRMLPVHGGAVVDRFIEMAPGILAQLKTMLRRDGEATQNVVVTPAAPGTEAGHDTPGTTRGAGGGMAGGGRIVTP